MTAGLDTNQTGRLSWLRPSHPAFRYILLAPAALTTIANLDDIGRLAHNLVHYWQPALHWIGALLDRIPKPWHMTHGAEVLSLFFLPFALEGCVRYFSGACTHVKRGEVALAIVALAMIVGLLASGGLGETAPPPVGAGIALALMFVIAGFVLFGVVLMIFRRKPLPVLAMPMAAGLCITVLILWGASHDRSDAFVGGVIALYLVAALPFFAPRRLIEVAALALGVLSISLIYDGLSGAIAMGGH